MSNALIKIGSRIASNPGRAIAAAPILVEAAVVLAPVAAVGAAGYGIYRLVKQTAK